MIISDLNYLEVISNEAKIVGSGGVKFDSKVKKEVEIDKYVEFDIFKFVESEAKVKGNLATAQAIADAYGKDSLSETDTAAQATEYTSESYSESVAATY